jgi:hypothetical protein
MTLARVVGTAAVVLIALAVAVPLVSRLAHALIVPAVVGVGLYVAVKVTQHFTEL